MAAKTRARGPATAHKGPITDGHVYGIKHYKVKKFGEGRTAWLAFEDWIPDVIGRKVDDIRKLRDTEAVALIEKMKTLPDVPPPGQESLGL